MSLGITGWPREQWLLQETQPGGGGVDCLHKDACPFPGEKLDYKTCEALEEVFKRLQFKVVDLEQTNLDEDVSSCYHQALGPS